MESAIDPAVVDAIRGAKHIVVLTGAGTSAESGIATFRDALTGLWARFDPSQLATPRAFAADPELVSRWYDQRRGQALKCHPNPGHVALTRWQEAMESSGKKLTLITQNVDGLHQASGAKGVLELHGCLRVWRCLGCGKETGEEGPAFGEYPVKCGCGGLKRPGVVWFEESLPADVLGLAVTAAQEADLFLSVGTSGVVYPAAGLVDVALKAGAKVLEVNPEKTGLSARVTWSIQGKAGEVLPGLVEQALA